MAEPQKNVPVPIEKREIVYEAADGQKITLSIEMVKRYLITPAESADRTTTQELVFFMNICRSRGLNPLIRDVYPVKYGNDPLAIITSIDFLRKRAAAEPDCEGWDKGCLILTKDGEVKETHGLVLEGQKLVGGWFRGFKKGWRHDFYIEVNLASYLKKTKEGNLTRFWQPENQPTMIAKVAEAQGLRTMWPGKFSKLFVAEEAGSGESIVEEIPPPIDIGTFGTFDGMVRDKRLNEGDAKLFDEYVSYQAAKNKVSLDKIKEMAAADFEKFFSYFDVYKKKIQEEKKPKQDPPKDKPKKDQPKDGSLFSNGEKKDPKQEVTCPDTGEIKTLESCAPCPKKDGCPEL